MRGLLLAVILVLLLAAAGATPPAMARPCPGLAAAAAGLGWLAFLEGGRLKVLDPADCRLRTVVARGASAPVRWSADGGYIGFGAGAVVPAGGGQVTYPLGELAAGFATGSPGWLWSPSGHRLAGVGLDGGVRLGGPGTRSTRLLPAGWGATSVAFSPGAGTLAVGRSRYPHAAPSFAHQVWLVQLASGTRREIFGVPSGQVAPPWLYGSGRVIAFVRTTWSAAAGVGVAYACSSWARGPGCLRASSGLWPAWDRPATRTGTSAGRGGSAWGGR